MSEKILIVEDEETLCQSLQRVLTREGYRVDTAGTAEDAMRMVGSVFYHVIITDIILPGLTGIELLKAIKEKRPDQIVVVMTAYASLETAVDALRSGAYDYVVKPVMHEEIKQIVRNALRQGALMEENSLLRGQLNRRLGDDRLILEGRGIRAVMSAAAAAAESDKNVLLLGEAGCELEPLAREIHRLSTRSDRHFIPVYAGATEERRLSERLFGPTAGGTGHVAGYTRGLLERADGGTVYFDEIASLPLALQQMIIDAGSRLGQSDSQEKRGQEVDVRFVFSTSVPFETAVSKGMIVNGIADRARTVSLRIPPLRERKDDILYLAGIFMRRYAIELSKTIGGFDSEVVSLLAGYSWPGNVRELKAVIERAVLVCNGETVRKDHLSGICG